MPRAKRCQEPGAVLHLGTRGAVQQVIYLDDTDRLKFLEWIETVVRRYSLRCLTYCLMGNHYHLVVELTEPNLSQAMHRLNGEYARLYNERHERSGHVFQSRFWCRRIRRDAHLLGVFGYVALNPVRAGLCARAEDWRWSAHRALAGLEPPGFVDVERMLSYFGTSPAVARKMYLAMVSA